MKIGSEVVVESMPPEIRGTVVKINGAWITIRVHDSGVEVTYRRERLQSVEGSQ